MHAMEIDESRWPLLVHTYDGQQTDDDITYYLRRLDEVHARRKPFATLTLIRRFAPHISHVTRLGAWMNANRESSKGLCKAGAIVVASASARFMLSSFYLISSIDYPHVVCDDRTQAEAWLAERMIEAKLPITKPPSKPAGPT
jgi:hypothetical protein